MPPPLDAIARVAVPSTYVVAVTLITLEIAVLRAMRRAPRGRTILTSLASGALAFGLTALASALFYAHVLDAAYARRGFTLGTSAGAWVVAFVLYDLAFWIGHVAGHRVRVLWCFHAVHHTTPEMSLTAAVRGSAFDFIYLPWFFVWIPLLGVHPLMLLAVESASRTWGVLTHVSPRLVARLGPLEGVVITPSAHRVHHGVELAYLDRNYGEVLTVWDRLFGTWIHESEAPRYGLTTPLPDDRLVTAQRAPWAALLDDLRRAPHWRARLRYLFDAPGWSHDGPDARVSTLRRHPVTPAGG